MAYLGHVPAPMFANWRRPDMGHVDPIGALAALAIATLPAPRTLSHALGYGGMSQYVAWWFSDRLMFSDGRIAAGTAGDAVWSAYTSHPAIKPRLPSGDIALVVAEPIGRAFVVAGEREPVLKLLMTLANEQKLPRPVDRIPPGETSVLDDFDRPDQVRFLSYSKQAVRTGWPGSIQLGATEQATAYAESLVSWLDQLPVGGFVRGEGEGAAGVAAAFGGAP